ncbi:hypothetical protein GQ55_6G104800 [Panicum hallii var. hallii]|uniref:Uncharacterized protein n=1 Tax=Panicum hallii var. hallii TaxID=1504633 RepID=A0A2T7D5K0_9POAL|nr:hypothetical protein GQ55_6G104800 [Panicum hallii var. hallii]
MEGLRVNPIYSQQTIVLSIVSRKGKEQEYAAMSQEEKNARNLRKHEVRQKNKGARCMSFLWCYRYITCNLDGSIFQGCCKLAGYFNTLICFVTLTHVYLLWFWSLCGSHNVRKRIRTLFDGAIFSWTFTTCCSYICTNYL